MNVNNCIYAKTHAQFLNKLLHLSYKAYMKCTYPLRDGKDIWMIRLNGSATEFGWVNTVTDRNNTVIEQYVGDQTDKLLSHCKFPLNKRAIFKIEDEAYKDRKYVFLGIFELDKKSNNNCRIWNKITDRYDFY